MERQKVNADQERDLLIGMILSDEFLRDIRVIMDIKLLRNPFSRKVANWCLQYYERYEEAPKTEIQTIYEGDDSLEADESAYIEKLLLSMSKTAEKSTLNFKYRLDTSESYLKQRKLEKAVAQIRKDLDDGDVSKAENRIATFERVARPIGEGISILDDKEKVYQAIDSSQESMLQIPGCLGEMLGWFYRGDLVGVAGPMKRGKSWWLQFFAEQSLNMSYQVLFVSLEMQEDQMVRRIVQSFTGAGIRDQEAQVPRFAEDRTEGYTIAHDPLPVHRMSRTNWDQSIKTFKRMNPSSKFRILTFPQDSLTVTDLEMHLENLEFFDDFIPDVIVLDYADIMAPEKDSPNDYRHRLDHIWKKLRGLAQKRNCLIFTGSQTDRKSLRRDAREDSVAEDIRKLAHVAKMIGLNQSGEEKKLGIMRLALWLERHDRAIPSSEVVITQCLEIGKPYLDSRWKRDVKGVYEDATGNKGTKGRAKTS